MNPGYLATLVFVGSNEKMFTPAAADDFQRYLRKFSKNGKLIEVDLGMDSTTDSTTNAPAPAPEA